MKSRPGIIIAAIAVIVAFLAGWQTLRLLPISNPEPVPQNADALWNKAQACKCLVVWTTPENGAPIPLKAINSAQKSIRLKMYLFTRDDIKDALIAAAKRGVDVRVIVELNVSGGAAANVDMYNAMKNSGVKWQWANYDFRFTHEKSLIVDDSTALIMTYNFTASGFNSNRGYGVINPRVDDIAEMINVYEADWQKVQPQLSNPRLVWSPINSRAKWIALIDSAQSTLDIEQEEWLSPEIVGRVADAARRGVKVRVIVPPSEGTGVFDQTPNHNLVRANGGQIKFFDDPHMVGKTILVDGARAFVGSENVSNNSLDNNRELGIIFDQPDAIEALRRAFEKDWLIATNDAFPVSDVPIPASGVVNWKDAPKFYNRDVIVEGKVVKTYNSGRVIFLQFSDNPDADMKAVIFPQDYGKFPDRPDKFFADKTIRVKGKVVKFQSAPEIIVNNADQILVVGQ